MLRVAQRAVVLIEPQETSWRLLTYLKDLIKRLIRKDVSTSFEKSGNYIFRINVREIEKKMISLNYECIAYRRLNDFYHPRFSRGEYARLSFPTVVTRTGIAVQNVMSRCWLLDYGLACVIAFKERPEDGVVCNLKRTGFTLNLLPKNPYLNRNKPGFFASHWSTRPHEPHK